MQRNFLSCLKPWREIGEHNRLSSCSRTSNRLFHLHPFQRIAIFSILCLFMTSCGFHLRGHQMNLSQHIPALYFDALPTDGLHQVVLKTLKAAKVEVNTDTSTRYHLVLAKEEWDTRILAYSPDSRPIRERLSLKSHYKLYTTEHRETPLLQNTLLIERERQLDPRLVLADTEEKQILQAEMRSDAAQQLLYQFTALNW